MFFIKNSVDAFFLRTDESMSGPLKIFRKLKPYINRIFEKPAPSFIQAKGTSDLFVIFVRNLFENLPWRHPVAL